MQLFMIQMGATPENRLIEQHDMFFGIAENIRDLAQEMDAAWPEAAGRWHIDCWRKVSHVDSFRITVVAREQARPNTPKLFFVNLGGYKAGEFEEYHHKMLMVADDMAAATARAKASRFYREFDFEGAASHIDERHGVDVDDVHDISDVLNGGYTKKYAIAISPDASGAEDEMHIGYVSRRKLME